MASNEALTVAKKQGTLRYQIKKNKACYIMLAPYFILFFLFTVLPVLTSICLSFTYFNMLEWPTFNGWNNYIKLFLEDDIFLISLKNTLIFAVVTGPISYLLCLLFAWIINEFSSRIRTVLTLIFYAPSICGNAYMVWSLILSGDRYGYLNGILLKWGIINEQKLWMQDAKYILPCLIVVQLWLSLGTGFLSFIAGLQTVDKSLYEAAALDGVKNRCNRGCITHIESGRTIIQKVGYHGCTCIVHGRITGKLYGNIRHRKGLGDLHYRTEHQLRFHGRKGNIPQFLPTVLHSIQCSRFIKALIYSL